VKTQLQEIIIIIIIVIIIIIIIIIKVATERSLLRFCQVADEFNYLLAGSCSSRSPTPYRSV